MLWLISKPLRPVGWLTNPVLERNIRCHSGLHRNASAPAIICSFFFFTFFLPLLWHSVCLMSYILGYGFGFVLFYLFFPFISPCRFYSLRNLNDVEDTSSLAFLVLLARSVLIRLIAHFCHTLHNSVGMLITPSRTLWCNVVCCDKGIFDSIQLRIPFAFST